MRKILLGAVITLGIVFGLRYCEHNKDETERLQAETALIEKQLKNVGKLVVTEGNYAQVFTYNDTKTLMLGLVESYKKALIVVNAKATIAYDLGKVKTQVDHTSKTVTITQVPEPELTINPNIEYYDITQQYLNQFGAADHNKIKKRIETSLHEKIEASDLKKNAENRLVSELQKIYILTSSMGWTLAHNGQKIEGEQDWRPIGPK